MHDHGAVGDGRTLDTAAINSAIAAAAGGGTVVFLPGRYLSFSIRLQSNITLLLEEGATIVAADPARHGGAYDPPEDGAGLLYQDFGHSHWHNSLIWGENIEHVAILGPGAIDGEGLTRDGPGARWTAQTGERPLSMAGMSDAEIADLEPPAEAMIGRGNKAIALKHCRDIQIADLTITRAGHFAILASGCEDIAIRDCMIDTNRDGIDLDCTSRAVIERCRVNTPNDDAICIKSSLALGEIRHSEDIAIRDCVVSGWDERTMLDGSYGRTQHLAPDRDRVTGRIKIGTESNGDFRHITIERCRFERSRGLAIETVDGGTIEDMTACDLDMEDVTTAPLFIRLGDRGRGPSGTGVGAIRRITIQRVCATGIDPRYAATLAALPDHRIEDVTLRDITLSYLGGGTVRDDAPALLATAYPEPSMFGSTPAWGLWCRHVRGLVVDGLTLRTDTPDARAPILYEDTEPSG
ncbi:rhamnogalacturonidase [Sphingomonas sp. AX6]|uniref:rhamnogalacturonidase n=1 Tax=Sphingomonas sp. AX6 TaxID=2653171 RepID=UPI001F25DCB8|nr:glycosyl hydrolase family 28 protein [Sphingomonas sp. AX6]